MPSPEQEKGPLHTIIPVVTKSLLGLAFMDKAVQEGLSAVTDLAHHQTDSGLDHGLFSIGMAAAASIMFSSIKKRK